MCHYSFGKRCYVLLSSRCFLDLFLCCFQVLRLRQEIEGGKGHHRCGNHHPFEAKCRTSRCSTLPGMRRNTKGETTGLKLGSRGDVRDIAYIGRTWHYCTLIHGY